MAKNKVNYDDPAQSVPRKEAYELGLVAERPIDLSARRRVEELMEDAEPIIASVIAAAYSDGINGRELPSKVAE